MEDQDRQRLAAVEQALTAVTARLNALAEGNFGLTAEGFRISSVRLFLKLVGSEYHLHQRGEDGTETSLVGGLGGAAASIADGGTIAHGLGTTPTYAIVIGSVENEVVAISALDATNITVDIKKTTDQSPGTSQIIYWRVWV